MKLGFLHSFTLLTFLLLLTTLPKIGNFNQSIELPKLGITPLPATQTSYWQNMEWIDEPIASFGMIRSCDFTSAENGWAVGENGTILHWDGIEWEPYPNPRSGFFTNLYSIDMLSVDNGWAVGEWGYMLHWDGNEWKDVSYTTDNDLFAVSFVSEDFGFATGGIIENNRRETLVLRWDGQKWIQVSFPNTNYSDTDPRLQTALMISRHDGWVSRYSELYKWNGESWEIYDLGNKSQLPFNEIRDFAAISKTDIWAAGSTIVTREDGTSMEGGGILHWDGSEWKEVFKNAYVFSSIKMFSPTMGWAIGTYRKNLKPEDASENVIFYWDGDAWEKETEKNNLALYTLCGFNDEHLWAFGGNGSLRLSQRSLPTQTPNPTNTATVYSTNTLLPEITTTPVVTSNPKAENVGQGNIRPLCLSTSLILGGIFFFFMYFRLNSSLDKK